MKRFLIIFVLFLCNVLVNAKPVQRPTSYNYQRGVEAYVNEKDHQKALDYLNKDPDMIVHRSVITIRP